MIKIGVLGISGRMGQAIVQSIAKNPRIELAGGTVQNLVNSKSDYFITDNPKILAQKSHVLIDFTRPSAVDYHLDAALEFNKPLVIGTTGFDADTENRIKKVSQKIPILQSGNMSLGVNVLMKLVKQAASILDLEWDVSITEAHHRHKIDSPSGTAIMLSKSVSEGRNIYLNNLKLSSEALEDIKKAEIDINFSSIRAGSIVGDHSVLFAHDDEMITLYHRAQNRDIFANGAVYAAEKLLEMPAGFYTMQDILPL